MVLKSGVSHAIRFERNGEFLVQKCVRDLLSYDTESKEFKDSSIHGGKDSFLLSLSVA